MEVNSPEAIEKILDVLCHLVPRTDYTTASQQPRDHQSDQRDSEDDSGHNVLPNEMRVSCGANWKISQIEDYRRKTAPPASRAC